MPAAEVAVDEALVRALLASQFPAWADVPLAPLAFGWDNAVLRLGDELLVRLPRREAAAELVEHEQRWLPVLAPTLPLPVPAPVAVGRPGCGYPWSWSVVPWLPGVVAESAGSFDLAGAAVALGQFVLALGSVDAPADAPVNPYRGVPLADRAEVTSERMSVLGVGADVRAAWRELVAVPAWSGRPRWLHGDLHPANLLVDGGRLSAVIDFGDVCAGDPATDLAVAWMLFPEAEREVFRRVVAPDDDTWARGRGWALSLALAILASSADNPLMAGIGRRTLAAVTF
jgi:aminoglycoside phosphotransferase (APT) family kinase protein